MERFIESWIRREVTQATTRTRYREPLVGFADADDPRFPQLPAIAQPTHLLPRDLLPEARSVVSFFLPLGREVVRASRRDPRAVAPDWAVAYLETNELIDRISRGLVAALAECGVKAAMESATHSYDPDLLIAGWSHKSVAAIAGLGSFGLHHMVITDAGCAGRFGSFVVDAALEPTSSPMDAHRERCPVGALTETGLDKHRCHERLLPFQFSTPQPWPVTTAALLPFAGLIGVVTILAFMVYTFALGWLQASVATILAMAEIPFVAVHAYFLLDEVMTLDQVIGALMLSWKRNRR